MKYLEAKRLSGPSQNKRAAGPPENKAAETVYVLDGVDFASDAAREEAIAAGLTATDFAGVEPAGATGITVGQVRDVVASKGA